MARYRVTLSTVAQAYYIMEADDEDDAIEQARMQWLEDNAGDVIECELVPDDGQD